MKVIPKSSQKIMNGICQVKKAINMEKLAPEISVLLPVYNAEQYIKETVESILNQTFSNFEFIIIDDGSTDRSLEILQGYAKEDGRIRLISRENKGLADTLNEGLKLCLADYIARIDSDDIATLERLEVEYNYLKENLDVVCVGSDFQLIDYKGRCIGSVCLPKKSKEIERALLIGECPIAHPSTMFLKKAINLVGGYNKSFFPAEDYALWIALLDIGKIKNLDTVLLKYRVHAAQVTQEANVKMTANTKIICEEACRKRGISSRYDENIWLVTEKSRCKKFLSYGWYAFKTGRRWMALEYALKAICQFPLYEGGYRLLLCSLVKRLPKTD